MHKRPKTCTDLVNVKVSRIVNDDRIRAGLPVIDGGLAQTGAGAGT